MGVLGRIGIVDSKALRRHLDTNYPVQHHSTRGSDRHANVVRSQVLVREPLELGANSKVLSRCWVIRRTVSSRRFPERQAVRLRGPAD